MKTPKNNVVVKESNAVARARIDPKVINIWEERIIALLVSKIRVEDKMFHEHKFSVMDICQEDRKLNGNEYSQLKKAIESLGKKTYILPKETHGAKVFPIFAGLEIDDAGNIVAEMNSKLYNHFLELKGQFALRSLPEFRSLSGIYAQQLFRYLNSWRSITEKMVSIPELHEFLSVPKSVCVNYAHFRRFVMDPATAEINAKTSLHFTWSPVVSRGRGHRVEAIIFVFTKSKPKPAPAPAKKRTTYTPPPAAPEDVLTPEYIAASLAAAGLIQAAPAVPGAEQFMAAARELSRRREFVRICDLRADLGWPVADFDAALRNLRDAGKIQLHAGNVTAQTLEEVAAGFVDENGYRMGNITIIEDVATMDENAPDESAVTGGGGEKRARRLPQPSQNKQKEVAATPLRQHAHKIVD